MGRRRRRIVKRPREPALGDPIRQFLHEVDVCAERWREDVARDAAGGQTPEDWRRVWATEAMG